MVHTPTAASSWQGREHRYPRRFFLAACALTGLAAVLRFYRIDHDSLVFDEAYTLLFSKLPIDRVVLVGGAHEHPPLYYLIVHVALGVRDSYLTPRIISSVVGSLAVFALYALGARLFNPFSGLVAAGLLAISPFHLWHSQVGRGYELAGLLVLLSYLCLFTALQRPRLRLWVAYGVCTALALYGEYITSFALLPQVFLVGEARKCSSARALLLVWAAIALSFVPWIGVFILNVQAVASDFWVPAPTINSVSNTVLLFLGLMTPCPSAPCVGSEPPFPVLPGHEQFIAGVTSLGVVGFLTLSVIRRHVMLAVLYLWLLLPFVLILLISMRRPVYLDRQFLDATYPLYLLLGSAVSRDTVLRGRTLLSGTAILIVVAGSLASLGAIYAPNVNDVGMGWKTATRELQKEYRSGQTVIFDAGPVRTIAGVYLPQGWQPTRERLIWLGRYLDVPNWQARYRGLTDLQVLDRQLTDAVRGQKQIWLFTHDTTLLGRTRWGLTHDGFRLVVSKIYYADRRLELWDRIEPRNRAVRSRVTLL